MQLIYIWYDIFLADFVIDHPTCSEDQQMLSVVGVLL